jgi:hypothetical protein
MVSLLLVRISLFLRRPLLELHVLSVHPGIQLLGLLLDLVLLVLKLKVLLTLGVKLAFLEVGLERGARVGLEVLTKDILGLCICHHGVFHPFGLILVRRVVLIVNLVDKRPYFLVLVLDSTLVAGN